MREKVNIHVNNSHLRRSAWRPGDAHAAQGLWNDPMQLEIPAKTDDEPRYLVIGLVDGKHWSAVVTYRGANIRLISVRRARAEEVALYES